MDLNTRSEAVVVVAGERVTVDSDAPVLATIKDLVREYGLGNPVQVLVDGEEVLDPRDLPSTFGDHQIELRRYAKAG